MNELALFAGAGGGILGGHLLGWRTVCAVEWEPYAACVLAARQNDGVLPAFPIWDDVQTFDGRPWRGIVDVVSGGFPCQDISAAGKGAGIDGERSGMWREMARIICEVRPRFVFVENSPMLTSRGLGVVLGDLAKMGFDAKWGVLGAADVGAPHQRDRIWIKATRPPPSLDNANSTHEQRDQRTKRTHEKHPNTDCSSELAHATKLLSDGGNSYRQRRPVSKLRNSNGKIRPNDSWWEVEPDVGRVVDGVAARVDRLKAIGNGQVPLVAATAWKKLKGMEL
jgi:DNA (cytosine-5)-methyltransferase 1